MDGFFRTWSDSPSEGKILLRRRLAVARALTLGALLICAGRAAQWCLIEGRDLSEQARANTVSRRALQGPRGGIYDSAGRPLAVNVRSYTVEMARLRNSPEEIRQTVAMIETLMGRSFEGLAEKVIHARSRWTRVRVADGLTLEEVTPVLEHRPTLSGVLPVEEVVQRHYPLGRVAAPVVGFVGPLWAEEVESARAQGLPLNARVGRAGIERSSEMILRGRRGVEYAERDARGRSRRLLRQTPGLPGNDLFLTIDATLQRAAYELLEGHKGTVVAMDPWTGEILAMAVSPTFDPNAPGAPPPEGTSNSFLNLAVQQHYPPGSPFKLVTALAAMLHHGRVPDPSYCRGRVFLDSWPGRAFHCDLRSGHGRVDLSDSLKFSCNVFFYEAAAEMGPGRLLDVARLFRLDKRTGIELPGEVAGSIPRLNPEDIDPVQEILLGIGQGPLALSPLQVLRMTAAVATRGVVSQPHLIRTRTGPSGAPLEAPPRETVRIEAPAAYWDLLTRAMYRVVNEERGTAYRAAFPTSWGVCGKTGTAQRLPQAPDAWFVGFAPMHQPEIAFVVMLEKGGHGGEKAAPIARDLLAVWFEQGTPRTPSSTPETAALSPPPPDPDARNDGRERSDDASVPGEHPDST